MSDTNYVTTPGVDEPEVEPENVAGEIPYTPVQLMGKHTPPERPASRLETGRYTIGAANQVVQVVGRQPGRRQIDLAVVGNAVVYFASRPEAVESIGAVVDGNSLAYDGPIYMQGDDAAVFPITVTFVATYDDGES